MSELTPHELIQDCYPIARACISPLVEIAKVNKELLEEVIELAIIIGINSAHNRIEWDKRREVITKVQESIGLSPKWHGIGSDK